MKLIIPQEVYEVFNGLPHQTRVRAVELLELICLHPRIHEVRRFGLMKGNRHFFLDSHHFYYSLTRTEIRLNAILPRGLRRA
ncbi:MAG: hypothetical protein NTV52_34135 [Acidobacteria bacterium]|nr:hypothetical protein [Acidobacteriota bacterium]